jgi:hypothetical protein
VDHESRVGRVGNRGGHVDHEHVAFEHPMHLPAGVPIVEKAHGRRP